MNDIVSLKDCDMHTVGISPKITITCLKANQDVRVFPGGTTNGGDPNIPSPWQIRIILLPPHSWLWVSLDLTTEFHCLFFQHHLVNWPPEKCGSFFGRKKGKRHNIVNVKKSLKKQKTCSLYIIHTYLLLPLTYIR